MDGYLRQSTASQARLIGPFVDDTDFKTAETGLTIANTDVKLRANGTTLSNKNSGGGTHQVNGMYSLTWDATDTANVGELKYSVVVAGALPVFGSYVVLEEAVYDALFAASAPGYASQASVDTIDDFLDTEIAAIKAKTDNLPSDPADQSLIIAATDALATLIGDLPTNAELATALDPLPTAAENAAALMDLANGIETGLTPRQAMRLMVAALAGKLSGAATTTITIRNVGDSKDRITATVDADGNRTAVTTDAT